MEYFTFGQIQDMKEEFYSRHGQGLPFRKAVSRLRERGLTTHVKPDAPDFLSFDPEDTAALRQQVEKIPISVEEIEAGSRQVRDGVLQVPTIHLQQISQESCYTGDELVGVDHFTLLYVLEGSGILNTPTIRRELTAGQVCLIPPRIPYCVFTRREDLVINILSSRERFQQDFGQLLFRNNLLSLFFRRTLFNAETECLFFYLMPDRDAHSLICHMFHEFVRQDDYSAALFSNYLQIFYATMMRSRGPAHLLSGKRESRYQTVLNILRYIHENFRDVTLQDLSRLFHYESDYLSKLIREFTGENYSSIVSKLKLDHSRELLEKTDLSVAAVAEQSGYGSPEHFSYAFRTALGVSPRQYRKDKRNNISSSADGTIIL